MARPCKRQRLESELSGVKPSTDDAKLALVIGIDFGTTFSGVAYGITGDATTNAEVYSITEWPGLEGRHQPKVDTLINYQSGEAIFTWGAQARKDRSLFGFKLLLDPDQKLPLFFPLGNGAIDLQKTQMPAEQITSDYLGALHKHTESRISNRYPKSYLDRCSRKYVLTVPAVWSDRAKNSTLNAAKSAGIDPVELITEPEAAALYTLHMMRGCDLHIGDAFVVCDAGGGTVDLASYEIKSLSPRVELREVVPGNGDVTGSLVLNRRFKSVARRTLGEENYNILKKLPCWAKAIRHFDTHIKPAFKGDPKEEYSIDFSRANLANDVQLKLEDDCWSISGKILQEIFAPVLNRILALLADQVSRVRDSRRQDGSIRSDGIKSIFLVGGFGSNSYLQQSLRGSHPDIQIIQPHDAWSAIAKGAVFSQMPCDAIVLSSVAKRHYGVKAFTPYLVKRDAGQPKTWFDVAGAYKCRTMEWYIKLGDSLTRGEKIRFAFQREFCGASKSEIERSNLIFTESLLACDRVDAPEHPADSVYEYASVTADLTGIDQSLSTVIKGKDGKEYVRICFELVLTPMSGMFHFALEIEGKEYGSVKVKYF